LADLGETPDDRPRQAQPAETVVDDVAGILLGGSQLIDLGDSEKADGANSRHFGVVCFLISTLTSSAISIFSKTVSKALSLALVKIDF
jgi:hypothetical protein